MKVASKLPAKGEKRRIFLIDDHPVLRAGLKCLLEAEPDLQVCGEADNAKKAVDQISVTCPEIAIVDISLPGANGIELVKNLKARFPRLQMLMLSMHDEALYAERALRAGAKGYVMKQASTEELLKAVRRVSRNEIYLSESISSQILGSLVTPKARPKSNLNKLSDRELEVVRLLGKGFTTSEVAQQLGISCKTVESHKGNLRKKLNLGRGSSLLRYAMANSEERI